MRLREQAAGLAFEPAERAFFGQGLQMALDAERAGEVEVRLDFADRGRHAVLAVVGVDEVEHLLLAVGEWFGRHVFS
jgi:hypothetical protein